MESVCEVWGDGDNKLPFVLVADVASALIRGIQVPGIDGQSYNLIDVPLLTARDYLSELQRLAGITLHVHYRPIWRFYVSDLVKWGVKLAVGHPDRVRIPSYRDWESRTARAIYDCSRARAELGWMPASDRQRMIVEGIGGSLRSWLAACGIGDIGSTESNETLEDIAKNDDNATLRRLANDALAKVHQHQEARAREAKAPQETSLEPKELE